MDNFYLTAVVEEITPQVLDRTVAWVSASGSALILDLRLPHRQQLRVSLDPGSPAIYLSNNKTIQSPSGARTSTLFPSLLHKHVAEARLVQLIKDPLDRVVQVTFEKHDLSDSRIRTSLVLALTGRSTNAYLVDRDGIVLARMFERGAESPAAHGQTKNWFVPGDLTELEDSSSKEFILERFFGNDSNFGRHLKDEFLARCKKLSAVGAFKSLTRDLADPEVLPLVYSRVPLEEVGQQIINPQSDLILSHIVLARAEGLLRYQFSSLSEAADQYYSARGSALAVNAEYASLRQLLAREVARREMAIRKIAADRVRFDDPDKLKRYGDLLLANLAGARVSGATATVIDYYDPDQNEIDIPVLPDATLEATATDYFRRYKKARRALTALSSRETEVTRSLTPLTQLLQRLEEQPTFDRILEINQAAGRLLGAKRASQRGSARGKARGSGKGRYAFGRWFKSSDGYEIVVGRNDRDNDALTFRIARSKDTWLHAADYPGSHVIIRNPTSKSPPHRTLVEAAELAAYYSGANGESKAAVHYTQRKFVSKPPRSKPGLVRLSSFKTMLVKPRCVLEKAG